MIIILGLAGSGKSTQGQLLAQETGMIWLSAGQVLRESHQFDEIMERGDLVPDEAAIEVMFKKMAEIVKEGKNAILDGFPRDKHQAKFIAEQIISVIEQIIVIDVPKDELIRRLMLRGREDDTREAIEKRFEIAEENNTGIIEILGEKGVPVRTIDGVGTVEEVFERLKEAVYGQE